MKSGPALPLLLISNATASLGAGVAMIAVPWLLVNRPGGAVMFGQLATIVNIILFITTPFIGPFIDINPRKTLMISIRVVFIVTLIAITGLAQSSLLAGSDTLLVVYYTLGSFFYAFNIPLRSAYIRELFSKDQFVRVNSMMEIENQVAAVLTGVVAIFVIERYGLGVLAMGNIACFAIAIACIMAIPPVSGAERAAQMPAVFPALADGLRITIRRPATAIMLIASTIPYVVVIFYTILHPIALSALPDASGATYALVELLFGLGAIAGGILMARVIHPGTALRPLLEGMVFVFAIIAVTQAMFQTYWGFVLLAAGFGLWNATTRILRQSILMRDFGINEIGRVGAFLQGWIMLLRASGIATLTILINGGGAETAIWFAAFAASIGPILLVLARLPASIKKQQKVS